MNGTNGTNRPPPARPPAPVRTPPPPARPLPLKTSQSTSGTVFSPAPVNAISLLRGSGAAQSSAGHEGDHQSSEFARLATRLSTRLDEFEKVLGGRSGKFSAGVEFESEDGLHSLVWSRSGGSDWRLWVWDKPTEEEVAASDGGGVLTGVNGRPLIGATLNVKIAAAERVPELMQKIEAGERAAIIRIQAALTGLERLIPTAADTEGN